jgi:hypothetical protein
MLTEKNEWRKATSKNFEMVSTWKNKKKGKTSKFVDEGCKNWSEREGINNMELIKREKWRKIKLKLSARKYVDW